MISELLKIIYPPHCYVCSAAQLPAPDSTLCQKCWDTIIYLDRQICQKCGAARPETGGQLGHYCGHCLKGAWPFNTARSLVKYDYPVTNLLHRLKYQGDRLVLKAIGEIIARGTLPFTASDYDYIVPVPLHSQRLKQRGLNQAALLARLLLAPGSGNLTRDLLLRVQQTKPQTGLNGVERRRNLKKAFAVNTHYRLAGARICLVDDVFTTGTTVSECTKTLLKSGAHEVFVWCLARV